MSADGGETWRGANVGFTNDGVFYLNLSAGKRSDHLCRTYNGVNRSTDQADLGEMDEGWPQDSGCFDRFDPNDPDTI
jgi:hypothetical protein